MRPWNFDEFEENSATVKTPAVTTADDMSYEEAFTTKSSVGSNGVINGSLQSASGGKQDIAGRPSMVVDYLFHVSADAENFDLIVNGDRLVIGSKTYEIVHLEDETGAGLARIAYLRLIE